MWAPIYGVLFLDPPRLSPLELVKSRDVSPAYWESIELCGQRGTQFVNHQTVGQQALRTCSAPPASAPFRSADTIVRTARFLMEAAESRARATQVVKE